MTVTSAEFASALEIARPPVLRVLSPDAARSSPNVEIRANGGTAGRSIMGRLNAALFGYKALSDHSPQTRSAVASAVDSLERRLATMLHKAPHLEAETFQAAVAGAHIIFDADGLPSSNRFGLIGPPTWDKLIMADREFAMGVPVWGPNSRVCGNVIWLRQRHLTEAQAVMFHRSAVSGSIQPFDPSPGQTASAGVVVTGLNLQRARVLVWPGRPVAG